MCGAGTVGGQAAFIMWRGELPAADRAQCARESARASPTDRSDRSLVQVGLLPRAGGVLFEIATDGPGFTVDEDPATLGEHRSVAAVARTAPRRDRAALPRSSRRR